MEDCCYFCKVKFYYHEVWCIECGYTFIICNDCLDKFIDFEEMCKKCLDDGYFSD